MYNSLSTAKSLIVITISKSLNQKIETVHSLWLVK